MKAFLRISTRAFEAYIVFTESVSLSNWSFYCNQLRIEFSRDASFHFSDSTSILLLEIVYLVALGVAAGFAQNYVKSFVEKLAIDLMDERTGGINFSMHSNVLKLKNIDLSFSAFGCFDIDFKVIKMVKINKKIAGNNF